MEKRGITRGGLSRETGIPYTTIVGFYDKGYENIKLSNVKKLADYFDVSLEYLCRDGQEGEYLSPEIQELVRKYGDLSDGGQDIVNTVIDGLLRLEAQPEEGGEIEYIREYLTPAAAGYASPAVGEDYIMVPKDKDVPRGADFAVRIDGDSMEPYIMDGSRVYVKRTNDLSDGDVGVFFVNGDMKCKQYVEDHMGNIYLFSLNRQRSDADVEIPASSGITVFCFGKVLLPKRPPLPEL
ncbi:MAG: helix-turn-helix domain-containing protein [Oscillospiraceae bacterium]|nr:helix-turn-helix domain-containing protein [Oscillospiraceae bacterium]